MKRKILAILLCGVMILGITGCGNKKESFQEDEEVSKIGKLDLEVQDISDFHDDLAKVKVNGKYGFIDKLGNIVVETNYISANNFSDGLALVCTGTNASLNTDAVRNCGYIDKTGEVIIDLKYENGTNFKDGIAIVKKGIKSAIIDKTGKELTDFNYTYASTTLFDDKMLFIDAREGGLTQGGYTILDSNYKSILTEGVADSSGCSNGLCSIKALYVDGKADMEKGKFGYVDYTGKLVIDYKYDKALSFNENGLALIVQDKKIGVINKTGNVVIDAKYDDNLLTYPEFNNGLILLTNEDKELVAFDENGKEKFKLGSEYSMGTFSASYSNGYIALRKKINNENKYVFVDINGKEVFDTYDSAYNFSDGLAYVKINDSEFAFINTQGKAIIGGKMNK